MKKISAGSRQDLKASALGYAGAGMAVFPLHSVDAGRCTCGRTDCDGPGKHPRTNAGFKDSTTDPEVIEGWWKKNPDANIGIRTGGGLVVLDVDPEHGGDDSLHELEREHGQLPATKECLTGGGGRHLYYEASGNFRNSAGKLGPGLDIRGDGGFVVAPPSLHISGNRYVWEVTSFEVEKAAMPDWLEALLAQGGNGNAPAAAVSDVIPQGKRNAELASVAGTMRRRGMVPDEILAALTVANEQRCKPPLHDDEVEGIAASVGQYEPAYERSEIHHSETPREHLTGSAEADDEGTEIIARPVSDIEAEPVEWLEEGTIPIGVITLLAGREGLGKSQEACRVAARTTRGLNGPAKDVFYLSAEDAPSFTIRPRLEAAGANLERVHLLTMKRDGVEGGLDLPDDIEELSTLAHGYDIGLIIVDPLLAHVPDKIDSWKDQSIRRVLAPLAKLTMDRKLAALAILHLNKAPGSDPLLRIGGSIGLPAAARSVLLLARDPEDVEDGPRRVLAHIKCNLAPLAASRNLTIKQLELPGGITTSHLTDCGESGLRGSDLLQVKDDEEKGELDAAIDFLETELAGGEVLARGVLKQARQAGVSERTLRRAKQSLGVISRKCNFKGGWVWELLESKIQPSEGCQPPRQPSSDDTQGHLHETRMDTKNEEGSKGETSAEGVYISKMAAFDKNTASSEGCHPSQGCQINNTDGNLGECIDVEREYIDIDGVKEPKAAKIDTYKGTGQPSTPAGSASDLAEAERLRKKFPDLSGGQA